MAGTSGEIKSASNQISKEGESMAGQDIRLISSGKKVDNFMTTGTTNAFEG
jgi:hypothetical protein